MSELSDREPRRIGAVAGLAGCALLLAWTAKASPVLAVMLFAVAALAALRPAAALAVVIATTPVVTYAATALLGASGDWAEALVLALLAGTCARRVWRPDPVEAGAVSPWALVFGATVITSAVVQLAADRAVLTPVVFDSQLIGLLGGYGLSFNSIAKTVHDAARLVEGLGLLALVASVATTAPVRRRLLRLFLVGLAANALLNVERIVSGALRRNALDEVPTLLRVVRLSLPHGDVNAAGSEFALALLIGAGLLLAARRRLERTVLIVLLAACGAGLWITGSRAAVVALVAMALAWMASAVRRVPARVLLPAAVAALLLLWLFPNPVFSRSATGSLSIRYAMASSGLRMWQSAPIFGAGIGQFYQRSSEFIQDDYVRMLYGRENAHNNFLQIGSELGLVGFVGFIGLLVSAAFRYRAARADRPADVAGTAFGAGAFLLTCLGGHPLLVTEVSIAFWFATGIICAAAPQRPVPRRGRIVAWWVVAALALTLPLRASHAIANANYEHVAYGVGPWQIGDDGERFREVTGDVTLFVPRWAISVDVPYRLRPGNAPVTLRVEYRDRTAAVLRVDTEQWRTYRLIPPAGDAAPNYSPLRFIVVEGRADGVILGREVMRARNAGNEPGR